MNATIYRKNSYSLRCIKPPWALDAAITPHSPSVAGSSTAVSVREKLPTHQQSQTGSLPIAVLVNMQMVSSDSIKAQPRKPIPIRQVVHLHDSHPLLSFPIMRASSELWYEDSGECLCVTH